jgi:ribose/xylose/arabinose/galactoside ABC-type transport system permease subunit
MARWVLLLIAHVTLLVLASTSFTVITGLRDSHFQGEYLKYVSQSGWGPPYQFPYTLPVVLTYLAAYGTGLATYIIAWQKGARIISATGVLLCAIGFASFTYELTHWMSEHYGSWIFSLPAPLLLLAVAAAVQYCRMETTRSTRTDSQVV